MVTTGTHLTREMVWNLLSEIPDPDIPVISITELGMVRDVEVLQDDKIVVTLTPSYSGCPAMQLFKEDIKAVLKQYGAKEVEVKIIHSPAWTTDWLSEEAKEKMRKHGIAPPEDWCGTAVKLFGDAKRKITCPHCGKQDTKLTSQFGSTPCKALWFCNGCNQPFEYFKCY